MHKRFSHELQALNEEQTKAVIKSILSQNFHMVLGMPGSGKTICIVIIVRILVEMNQKVLITGFSNQEVDNVLLKLKESGFNKFVRITNNITSAHQSIRSHVKTASDFDSMDSIRETIASNYVYASTCLSMNNDLLTCLRFDYCIMDEASQVTEPLSIGPILRASKFVMFGDYYQLNPQLRSDVAEKKGMNISLFEKLCKRHPTHCSILKT